MTTERPKGTYFRAKVPRGLTGTCPFCLRSHEATTKGRLYRHGWTEFGRRVGEYGYGVQSAACTGTGYRPLQETDEDGLYFAGYLRELAVKARERAEFHGAHQAESYRYKLGEDSIGRFSSDYTAKKAARSEAAGLEVTSEERKERDCNGYYTRKKRVFWVKLPRGTEADKPASYKRPAWPSYADQATYYATLADSDARSFESHAVAIEKAIEKERATPIKVKAKKRKGPAVHAKAFWKGKESRGVTGLCKKWGFERSWVSTTEDPDKVTCKRCRKALGLSPEPPEPPEEAPAPEPKPEPKAAPKPKAKKVAGISALAAEAAKPEAAKPEAAKPEAAKPEAAKPKAAKPKAAKPKAAKPKAAKPKAAKPRKGSELNEKEAAVLAALQEAQRALTLAELAAAAAFGDDSGVADPTSWVRNSLRKLIRNGPAARVGRGLYYAEKPAASAACA